MIAVWTVLLLGVLAFEIYGIYRPQKNDTITETYRWYRDKLPDPLRYIFVFIVLGLLMWTIMHFVDLV